MTNMMGTFKNLQKIGTDPSLDLVQPDKTGVIDLRKEKEKIIQKKIVVDELFLDTDSLPDDYGEIQFKISLRVINGNIATMDRAKLQIITDINEAILKTTPTRNDGTKLNIKTQIITR